MITFKEWLVREKLDESVGPTAKTAPVPAAGQALGRAAGALAHRFPGKAQPSAGTAGAIQRGMKKEKRK
jgi:hypothetical protein